MKDFRMEWGLGRCRLGLQSAMEDSFKVFLLSCLHLKEDLLLSLLIVSNQVSFLFFFNFFHQIDGFSFLPFR